MPVIRGMSLSLDENEVLRREGIRQRSTLRLEIATVLHGLLASVDDLNLLEPAMAYESYRITEVRHDRLCLEGNVALRGSLLPSVVPQAKELAAVICTIGPKLEKEATDYFGKSEPLRGLLLDGIGSAAVDSLAQEVCRFMRHKASSRGYQTSSPLNPGMPGFPISEQWQMLKLVPAEEIGVSLAASGTMVPCKSISMVIGIGLQMTTWTQAEGCACCILNKTCRYRIHRRVGK